MTDVSGYTVRSHAPITCPRCGAKNISVYETAAPLIEAGRRMGGLYLASHGCPDGGDHMLLQNGANFRTTHTGDTPPGGNDGMFGSDSQVTATAMAALKGEPIFGSQAEILVAAWMLSRIVVATEADPELDVMRNAAIDRLREAYNAKGQAPGTAPD